MPVRTHGYIVLPHWETRPPASWPDNPTQSHYPGIEPSSSCPILIMPKAWLGSDKYKLLRARTTALPASGWPGHLLSNSHIVLSPWLSVQEGAFPIWHLSIHTQPRVTWFPYTRSGFIHCSTPFNADPLQSSFILFRSSAANRETATTSLHHPDMGRRTEQLISIYSMYASKM